MRLLAVFLLSCCMAISADAAEKGKSWKTGVWDKQRMEPYEAYELAWYGEFFLLGRLVSKDIQKAEILFEGAAIKDPSLPLYIGLIYLNETDDKNKTLEWFVRASRSSNKKADWWLGLLLNKVGREILNRQNITDPLNSEALAMIQAAHQFGFKSPSQGIDSFFYQATSQILEAAKAASKKYVENPLLLLTHPYFDCKKSFDRLGQPCLY